MKTRVTRGNGIWKNHPFAGFKRFFYLTWFLVSISTLTTRGQTTILWDRTIGGDNYDNLSMMVRTSDGGYILGGSSQSGISGEKSQVNKGSWDYWVVKIDANGYKVWDKTFGGNQYDRLTAIQQTSDGGYILGGWSGSGISGDKSQANKGELYLGEPTADYWVVKLNAAGTKQWDKTIGGNHNDRLEALQQTSDGGYILGGWSYSEMGGDKSQAPKGSQDFWIVKLSSTGAKVWDKTLGTQGDDEFSGVQQTQDGGYIVGGYAEGGINGDKTEASKGALDYWIIKLNASGTKIWDKTIGGSSYDRLEVVQQTPDGGYILGGNSASGISGDKTQALRDTEEIPDQFPSDYWIVKLNASGTKIWDRTLGGTKLDYITSLYQTTDGHYILGGSSESGISGEKTEANRGFGYDFWTVKITANGQKIWDKTLGGDQSEGLASVQPATDGGFLLGGTSSSDISGDKTETNRGFATDIWVVKIKETSSNTSWNFRFGGTGHDNLTTVIQTSDGGYLSGGFTNSGISGDKTQSSRGAHDFWVVKTDKFGKKLWDKRYGGSGEDLLTNLIQTQDGGYLLGGSSLSGISGDKTQASRGDRDYWVIKIDAQGHKQWDKRFGGSGSDELHKLLQLPSGSYILAGSSSSPANGDKSQSSRGAQDYWLLKITSTGTKQWDKRFGGNLNDAFADLAFTLDGGFLLGGTSWSGINGDKTQASRGSSDYWLVRINGSGSKLWDKRFGSTKEDVLTALGSTGTSTGNFFIAGHSNSPVSGDKTQGSQGLTDYWMLKINGNGGKLWDKRFGGSQHDILQSIIITRDGGYLLGGSSSSGTSGDKTQSAWGSSDYWVVKTSSTGIKQWDKRFGGTGFEELRTTLQTPDGGYIFGGSSESGISGNKTQTSQGARDFWLVKLAPEALPVVVKRKETVAVEPTEEPLMPLRAYPNPFRDHLQVSFTLPQTQPVQVKVYDLQGRAVTTLFQGQAQAHQTYQLQWQAGEKAAGLYLLRLHTSENSHTAKLLLVR